MCRRSYQKSKHAGKLSTKNEERYAGKQQFQVLIKVYTKGEGDKYVSDRQQSTVYIYTYTKMPLYKEVHSKKSKENDHIIFIRIIVFTYDFILYVKCLFKICGDI